MSRPWVLWLPLVVFGFLLMLVLWGMNRERDDFVRSRLIGQPVPAFDLPPAVDGKPGLASTDLSAGQPRLVNFFGSWCIPCRAEAPHLDALARAGVPIDGIALRDEPANVAQFLSDYGDPFQRIGADRDGRLQVLFGATGVPETYLVRADGTILLQHIGDIRADDVPGLIQAWKAAG
ncbi:DsbE family thiol:disulfide interchange protein [Novosphingopyxis sp.]|uniref:DsbE family thiol:disulfide interchange protein n=1 Tax=Novosphingopyxis sp. TaxID=2709690 RepID=UPI003B5AF9AA